MGRKGYGRVGPDGEQLADPDIDAPHRGSHDGSRYGSNRGGDANEPV